MPDMFFTQLNCDIEGLKAWGNVPFSFCYQDYRLIVDQGLHITPPHLVPFEDVQSLLEFTRKWLNFVLNIPVNILQVRGQVAESEVWVDIPFTDSAYREISATVVPIFRYDDIAFYAEPCLVRWFHLCAESGRALETYFASFEATGISAPIRLLLIAQSLEVFHVDFVNERVPQRYNSRQKLRTPKLTGTGKIARIGSLEERYWDLAERYLADYAPLIQQLFPALDLFMAQLVDTRNYYTHGDRSHEYVVHSPMAFDALIRATRTFALLCWMRALELPLHIVQHIVSAPTNSHRFAVYSQT